MKRQCQALDSMAQKCHRLAANPVEYHGEPEIYYGGPEPKWVKVWLCSQHQQPKRASRPRRKEGK